MIRALALAAALLASPAFAVQPDEMLADPALEERARELSKGLRCLVCRNESIDESNADLARDMRILLRERIAGGDTDEEAVAFLVDRYGEYVLLRPSVTGANLILWIAGPAMLLGGAAIAGVYLRRRASAPAPAAGTLSEDEKSRLADLLRD
jgi:cytochrome c-type biogenesis protein CcmH